MSRRLPSQAVFFMPGFSLQLQVKLVDDSIRFRHLLVAWPFRFVIELYQCFLRCFGDPLRLAFASADATTEVCWTRHSISIIRRITTLRLSQN